MTTLVNPEPHEHRDIAESFGTDPALYHRTRTRYPSELIARIAAAGRDVLTVGAGTGIDARQLAKAGCRVLGIEPDIRMAAFANHTGVDVEVATFEDWEPAGRDFDTVVAATAWHWVDPNAGAAKAARILRPGGSLAVWWNAAEPPAEITAAQLTAMSELLPQAPRPPANTSAADMYSAMIDLAADGINASGAFNDVRRHRIDWQQHYTKQQWLDQLRTTGALTVASPVAVAAVLEPIAEAIDGIGGAFTVEYATLNATATLAKS